MLVAKVISIVKGTNASLTAERERSSGDPKGFKTFQQSNTIFGLQTLVYTACESEPRSLKVFNGLTDVTLPETRTKFALEILFNPFTARFLCSNQT